MKPTNKKTLLWNFGNLCNKQPIVLSLYQVNQDTTMDLIYTSNYDKQTAPLQSLKLLVKSGACSQLKLKLIKKISYFLITLCQVRLVYFCFIALSNIQTLQTTNSLIARPLLNNLISLCIVMSCLFSSHDIYYHF